MIKHITKSVTQLVRPVLLVALLTIASLVNAAGMLDYLTDTDGKYAGPSVEDNIAKMDTDNSGFADVAEVRDFLALKYGNGYQKGILDRWEIAAAGLSCGTTFAKDLTE
ncbi:MAG: hypothetical protein ABGW96_02545 [Methylophilaceae bacterium]